MKNDDFFLLTSIYKTCLHLAIAAAHLIKLELHNAVLQYILILVRRCFILIYVHKCYFIHFFPVIVNSSKLDLCVLHTKKNIKLYSISTASFYKTFFFFYLSNYNTKFPLNIILVPGAENYLFSRWWIITQLAYFIRELIEWMWKL